MLESQPWLELPGTTSLPVVPLSPFPNKPPSRVGHYAKYPLPRRNFAAGSSRSRQLCKVTLFLIALSSVQVKKINNFMLSGQHRNMMPQATHGQNSL
jgi:hypothetical protein